MMRKAVAVLAGWAALGSGGGSLARAAGADGTEGLAGTNAPVKGAAAADSFSLTELLPVPWQKNPRLPFMVVTDVSAEGKKRPEVSPGAPAYFELRSSGYRVIGDIVGEKTVTAEELEPTLLKALGQAGYYPAKPGHPPSLLIVYRWGAHYRLDPENPDADARVRNTLERAEMVGGEKFARDLEAAYREAAGMGLALRRMAGDDAFKEFVNPINRFKNIDHKNELLMDRTGDDIYYIVASAYDYNSMRAGTPVHLWRTRVTVPVNGVTQRQTLPTMLVTAAPFFGKETDRADLVARRTIPEGSVELGTATVVEHDVPPTSAAGAAAEKETVQPQGAEKK